jgi:hypothetical protein
MNTRDDVCPKCNSCAIVYFSSLRYKKCGACKHEWPWELKENQEPLVKYQR